MAENNAVLTQQAGGEHQICRRGVGINGQRLRLELGIHIGERDSAPVLRFTLVMATRIISHLGYRPRRKTSTTWQKPLWLTDSKEDLVARDC